MSCRTGVTFKDGEYSSRITFKKRLYDLGRWPTESEASNGYLLAKSFLDMHGYLSDNVLMIKILQEME